MLRFHGSKAKKTFEFVGYNSRLDEIQAAALRIFLRELDGWTAARREAAARYAELGLGELVELPADEPGHVYHLFVCRSPERDRIRAALAEAGIGNAQYYLPPLHLQPALRYLGYEEGELPETERAAAENFSLPLWAGISAEQQEQVVEVVRSAVERRRRAMSFPITRHRLPQLAADLAIVVVAWFLAFQLRFDPRHPGLLRALLRLRGRRARRRDQARGLHALRLLQPLVALRLDARHVGRRPRRHGGVARRLPRLRFFEIHRVDVPRGVWVIDWLLPLALVAASRMLARTIIERPQAGRSSRAARR